MLETIAQLRAKYPEQADAVLADFRNPLIRARAEDIVWREPTVQDTGWDWYAEWRTTQTIAAIIADAHGIAYDDLVDPRLGSFEHRALE
jgi:hypothetical protein